MLPSARHPLRLSSAASAAAWVIFGFAVYGAGKSFMENLRRSLGMTARCLGQGERPVYGVGGQDERGEKVLDDFASSGCGGRSRGAMGSGDGGTDFLVRRRIDAEVQPMPERVAGPGRGHKRPTMSAALVGRPAAAVWEIRRGRMQA